MGNSGSTDKVRVVLPSSFDLVVGDTFQLFYRGDSSRHNPDSGNGIGLFVSRQIMLANNAEIWAENNGDGLTMFASFPLVDDAPVDWFEM